MTPYKNDHKKMSQYYAFRIVLGNKVIIWVVDERRTITSRWQPPFDMSAIGWKNGKNSCGCVIGHRQMLLWIDTVRAVELSTGVYR